MRSKELKEVLYEISSLGDDTINMIINYTMQLELLDRTKEINKDILNIIYLRGFPEYPKLQKSVWVKRIALDRYRIRKYSHLESHEYIMMYSNILNMIQIRRMVHHLSTLKTHILSNSRFEQHELQYNDYKEMILLNHPKPRRFVTSVINDLYSHIPIDQAVIYTDADLEGLQDMYHLEMGVTVDLEEFYNIYNDVITRNHELGVYL